MYLFAFTTDSVSIWPATLAPHLAMIQNPCVFDSCASRDHSPHRWPPLLQARCSTDDKMDDVTMRRTSCLMLQPDSTKSTARSSSTACNRGGGQRHRSRWASPPATRPSSHPDAIDHHARSQWMSADVMRAASLSRPLPELNVAHSGDKKLTNTTRYLVAAISRLPAQQDKRLAIFLGL